MAKDDMNDIQKIMLKYADNLEEYVDLAEKTMIFPSLTEERVQEDFALIRDLIKKIRKGKWKKVVNEEALYRCIESGEFDEMMRE